MGGGRYRAAFAILLTVGCAQSRAAAQQGSVAEQLYRDGQKLIAAGDTHEACAKFQESERAEPALGTLIALAACHEREQKFASAWSEFSEAADVAERQHDGPRARYAKAHAQAIRGSVYRLRVDLAAPVAGATLKLGDREYGAGTFGSAIPLDPGDLVVEVRAPGKKTFSRTLHIQTGIDETVTVKLEDAPAPAVTAGAPPVAPAPVTSAKTPPARTVGLVIGGVGIALGVTAVVLEVLALSKASDADAAANDANAARSAPGYDNATRLHGDAVDRQRVAMVLGGLGVVGIATGAYLVFSNGVVVQAAVPAQRGGSALGLGIGARW